MGGRLEIVLICFGGYTYKQLLAVFIAMDIALIYSSIKKSRGKISML